MRATLQAVSDRDNRFIDPSEDLIGVLMTQQAWTSPRPPDVCVDFWTSVYQAIDD